MSDLLVRDPSWPWADLAALDHQDQSSPAPHHLISGRKKKKRPPEGSTAKKNKSAHDNCIESVVTSS